MTGSRNTGKNQGFIKNIQGSILRTLFYQLYRNKPVVKQLKFLRENENRSPEELGKVQFDLLKNSLCQAGRDIPFYKKWFSEAGFNPEDMKKPSDIEVLPLLDRQTINRNIESMRNPDIPESEVIKTGTGGSTGEPLHFYHTKRYISFYQAAHIRDFNWGGWRIGDGWARLWGANFDIPGYNKLLGRLKDALMRKFVIPAWELNENTIPHYARKLRKFRPVAIEAYITPLYTFARFLKEKGIEPPRPTCIFSCAETLFPEQRNFLEDFFQCKVYNKYATREFGPIVHECEKGRMHIISDHVHVEILKEGKPAVPGETGELIITGLHNKIMPLVRYRIGDAAIPANESSCPCGRPFPLLKSIEGRVSDILVLPEGRLLSGLFFAHLLKDYPVRQYQAVQETRTLINISVIPSDGFSDDHKREILRHTREHVGEGVEVNLMQVEALPTNRTGKFRRVICKAPLEFNK